MPKEKLKIVMATSLIWTVCLSSCASLTIKTWYLDGAGEHGLVRRASDGSIQEKLEFLEANGYFCYSPQDDEMWRQRLAICCAKAAEN